MTSNKFSSLLGGFCLIMLLSLTTSTSGLTPIQENIESYVYTGTRSVQRCYDCSYTTCTDFKDYYGWHCYRSCCYLLVYSYWYLYERKCTTTTNRNCCWQQETYYETRYQCKAGWTNYPYCNVAICNPECKSGQKCTKPNVCECVTGATGSAVCNNVPCSDAVNCYPGTCSNPTALTCTCPPGFEGTNCQIINFAPFIDSCKTELYANPGSGEKSVGVVDGCAAIGLAPPTVWVGLGALNSGNLALTKIDVSWDAVYRNPIKMPDRSSAPFVLNSPISIGITRALYTVTVLNSGSTGASAAPVICPDAKFDDQNIPTTVRCRNQVARWTDLGLTSAIADGTSLLINVTAQLGGQKRGAGQTVVGGYFTPQNFISSSVTQSMLMTFDFQPPTHCAANGRSDPTACDIYPITLDDITRNSRIQPKFNLWQDSGSGIKNFAAAVYYLKSNVRDLLEEDQDPIQGCTSQGISVQSNNFVCDLPRAGTYSIVVTAYDWAGNSAKARKIITYTGNYPSITNANGTEQDKIALEGADPKSDYRFITNLQAPSDGSDYQLTVHWPSAFKIVFQPEWMKAVKPWDPNVGIDDVYGTKFGLRSTAALSEQDSVLTYEFEYLVDSGAALGAKPKGNGTFLRDQQLTFSVTQQELQNEGSTIVMWVTGYDLEGNNHTVERRVSVHRDRSDIKVENEQFITQYNYQFNSSYKMDITSAIGGIKNISFEIYDRTTQNLIRQGDVANIAYRDWPQSFGTREKRQVPQYPNVCHSNDPTCYCIPLGICYNLSQYYVIDNCWIDRYAGHEIEIRYKMFSISGYLITNKTPFIVTVDASKVKCRPPGSPNLLLLLLLLLLIPIILLLILLIWRWRHDKHPIPTRVRTMLSDIRHRHSKSHTTENELYVAGNDLDVKPNQKINNLEVVKVPESKFENKKFDGDHDYQSLIVFDRKRLNMGTQTIGDGRFANIKKGTIQEGNHNITIAIKALKSGYSKQDAELMHKKIKELSKIQSHPNLVNLKGLYKDELYSNEPAMVLDYCDTPLADWLQSLKSVDPDALESMHGYSMDIARGMEHLHDNNIIHRRLTAKNVLLAHSPHNSVAKVTGFGPSKDDSGSNLVKIKWLAPETLSTLNSGNPTYNEQTDAWSYGVTLWEIYSKGEAPYGSTKSSDVLKKLKEGYRLPRPEFCPPELYETVMEPAWAMDSSRRPGFNQICTDIDHFKSGGNPQGYYGADDVECGRPGYGQKTPEGCYAPDKLDSKRHKNDYHTSIYNDAS